MDPAQESLADLELSQIDYVWIERQTKPNFLRKALKLLEHDGNYFPELSNSIQDKLKKLDPKYKSLVENQTIDPETKKKALDDLLAFEEEISQKNKKNIFGLDELSQRKAAAENEKIKGNEALKSNDLNEALNYYTKSLEYDPNLTASYCNRALVYLKMKKFKETIEDCNKVLEIDSSYIKAYHRRGKAYLELKNYVEAVRDFQAIMKLEPENKEVNADLKEARKNLTQKDLESLEKNPKNQSGFKKIQIQEEEEEEEDDKNSRILKEFDERKQKANELTKKGLFVEAIPFYETDLKLIDKMKNAPNEILAHKANLLNNISFCYAQSGEASKAIGYATDVINLKDVDVDQKVKALLRRAIQYEKIDKNVLAKEDFLLVKEFDPNNMKASQGLYRLREVDVKPRPKAVVVPPERTLEESLKEIETKKEGANDYFRKKDFKEAKIQFSEILKNLEILFKKEIENSNSKAGILYLQILNNRAFTNFNLNNFNEAIQDCDLTLSLDPNNLKGLYRRGLSFYELGKLLQTLEGLTEKEKLLDRAKQDIEKVLSLNKENQTAREKLEEIVKESVRTKLKLRENQPSKPNIKNDVKSNETKAQSNKTNEKTTDIKLDQDFLNDVTFNVAKKVMDELIESKELPVTANGFEKDCLAFKNEVGRLFFFIRKIPLDHFIKLFSKKEIPSEILLFIINSIKITGIKNDVKFSALFLENLTKTNKFDLVTMLLTKKEKKEILDLIAEIENHDQNLGKAMTGIKKALK